MPIRKDMLARYPEDWKRRSRYVRFIRAKGCCEWCGVQNYTVGRWVDGEFCLISGNSYLDNCEYATSWSEARAVADHHNQWVGEGGRYTVICLTVAHIHDHRPEVANLLNLAALCQRCHNRLDAPMRRANRRRRLTAESPQLSLVGV